MAAFCRPSHLSPASPGDRKSLRYATEGPKCFWRCGDALSHRSACHDGLLETLEPQVRLKEGKPITCVVSLLGNLAYSKMLWLPVLHPDRDKTPFAIIRVKAFFPGETGAATGDICPGSQEKQWLYNLSHLPAVKEKDRLSFPPRLEAEEPPLTQEGLDMSETLSCPRNKTPTPGCPMKTLYWACAHNDPAELQARLDVGVSPEEVSQVDSNGKTGLMIACYHGFGTIVALLSCCPFLDVNQQDRDGNTALMLASQAGHTPLVTLLLNYFADLDLERRDQRGLTALMKAAIRDRSECVVALLMAGADLSSVDPVRGKTALEWAVLTDSFDTVRKIRQLLRRPRAEQLSLQYQPEWPALAQLVTQARAQAAAPSLLERLKTTLSLSFAESPQEGGVLDHFVTVTTSLASPFLTTACHTLCPDHPPTLGTRAKSVPELLGTAPTPPPAPHSPQTVHVPQVFVPYQSPRMFSQWLQSRSQVPEILLSKAPSPPTQLELTLRPAGHQNLTLPLWRYQERKKQEAEAKAHGR